MPPENKRIYRKNARTLADVITPVTKPAFTKRGIAEMQLIRDWANIVGSHLAARATPFQLNWPRGKNESATLVIHTDGGFATELQHRETEMLERINTYFGYLAVAKLTIMQLNFALPEVKKNPLPPLPAPAKPQTEDDALSAALARLSDALQSKKS